MRKVFDFGQWWGCEIEGLAEGSSFTVYAPPYMTPADAESWCASIGGSGLHQGGYMLEPNPGQSVQDSMAEAQALCDALNDNKVRH